MRTTKRLLASLLVSFAAAFTAPAQAQQFSNVIVFGDSLSDAGYFRPFLLGLFTQAGIPNAAALAASMGRFTTNPGPVWSELVAQHYGVSNPAPSNAGGTIFAQGGARVALPNPGSTPTGFAERPLSTQITEYLTTNGGRADANALFALWGGPNDVLVGLTQFAGGQITPAQLQTNVLGAATAEIQQVGRLMGAGARYVAVFAMPDVGQSPAVQRLGPVLAGQVTQLSAGYNTQLFAGLAQNGLRVIPVDVFSLFAEIRANPGAFGFTNTTDWACTAFPPFSTASTVTSLFCNQQTLVTPNASETFASADPTGHPTTRTHRVIAQFTESLIDGPAQYSLLAEAALHTREGHIRTITEGLTTGGRGEIGRWSLFAAGDRGKFDVDSSAISGSLGSTNKSGSIGVLARVSEGVTLGVAVGRTESDANFGSAGGFSTRESVLSFFGAARCECGLYGTAILSVADVRFNELRRNIVLGDQTRTATSSPGGSNASFFASLGYDWRFGRVLVGPLASINSQNVDVDSFDEAGAGSANLHISSQKRRSELVSVGARVAFDLGAWTPWIRVTRDHERRGDDRFVTATPLSLATNNSYDIPAFNPEGNFTTGAVGIYGSLMQRIGVSLAYARISGRSGISQDAVSGMISYRF